VPLLPLLGVAFNVVMMYFLGWTNWLRLFVWMALGLIVYFNYSRKHSLFQKPEGVQPVKR
jgi:APA family basic amino acid/polyamine antiporter